MVSRKWKIPLERLHISYRIMKGSENVPMRSKTKNQASTFYIYGMWLYGAMWDQQNDTVCDLEPGCHTGNEIPTI